MFQSGFGTFLPHPSNAGHEYSSTAIHPHQPRSWFWNCLLFQSRNKNERYCQRIFHRLHPGAPHYKKEWSGTEDPGPSQKNKHRYSSSGNDVPSGSYSLTYHPVRKNSLPEGIFWWHIHNSRRILHFPPSALVIHLRSSPSDSGFR
ncbi:hypothetical protein D3C86_1585720 [compost metagenome]